MANGPNFQEARKRSVDNLQRLYTVVVSLAVTEGLKHLLIAKEGVTIAATDWLLFCAMLVTLVPFYHGANRYLDATYVTGERSASHYGLMLDFVVLFFEALIFFSLAMFLGNESLFYKFLCALLVIDIVWVLFTCPSASNATEDTPKYGLWAAMNFVAVVLIFSWNCWGWGDDMVKSIALLAMTATRTGVDYILTWRFYYPLNMDQPARQAPEPSTPKDG